MKQKKKNERSPAPSSKPKTSCISSSPPVGPVTDLLNLQRDAISGNTAVCIVLYVFTRFEFCLSGYTAILFCWQGFVARFGRLFGETARAF
jgi:hypothetical protein